MSVVTELDFLDHTYHGGRLGRFSPKLWGIKRYHMGGSLSSIIYLYLYMMLS